MAIISAWFHGTGRAVEDHLTADLVIAVLAGIADPSRIATDVDLDGFAMEARLGDHGHVRLVATVDAGDATD